MKNPATLAAALLLALATAGATAGSPSGTLRYCDAPPPMPAAQQDRLLRVSHLLRQELAASGSRAAIVARSGLNLRWFGMRYSHAGVSLQNNAETPWAVRQLYFSCDERVPRIFDQGLSAFLLGTEDPRLGYVSVLLLPPEASAAVEVLALDNATALSLLGAAYSANAYVYSERYQNCNQWLVELLALAWGGNVFGVPPRTRAQAWLRQEGFEASLFAVPWRPLLSLTVFSPFLQRDDHPEHELAQARFRVSMPESIEAFVRQRFNGVQRLELCHTDEHAVIRRGWEPIADGCVPGQGDTVVSLR